MKQLVAQYIEQTFLIFWSFSLLSRPNVHNGQEIPNRFPSLAGDLGAIKAVYTTSGIEMEMDVFIFGDVKA